MSEVGQTAWDQFVIAAPGGSFLQSWAWGEVQRERGLPRQHGGYTYWRLSTEKNGKLMGTALVIRRELPTGRSWLYVPRGPVVQDEAAGADLLAQITELARKERAVFVRIEPPVPAGAAGPKLSLDVWQKAEVDVQPRHTLRLNLTQSEEELLAAMHHKTRYNIRVAERRGVQVRFGDDCSAITQFEKLAQVVAARQPFHYHPPEYYEVLCRVLGRADMFETAVAEFEGQVLTVNLLISFGDTVTYVHGASSSEQRGLMAPHLLQWAAIQRAREAGVRWYDFFGVAPPQSPASGGTAGQAHPWSGITRFKEGFGGERVVYAGAYDLILDRPWYWLYRTTRTVRAHLR